MDNSVLSAIFQFCSTHFAEWLSGKPHFLDIAGALVFFFLHQAASGSRAKRAVAGKTTQGLSLAICHIQLFGSKWHTDIF